MKVLQINAVYGRGSTGRIVAEVAEAVKRTGGESFVAYQHAVETVENGFAIGNSFSRNSEALRSRVFGMQEYGNKSATKRLLRWIEHIQPSVVHLHNLHSHYVHLPLLLRYLAKNDIPTVITLHDCWFFTGKCTHYTTAKCNKWQTGCGNCPQLKKDIPSWFFDRTAKMWSDKKRLFAEIPRLAVIGVSDWVTGEAKKSFLREAKLVESIYNWIDLSVFYPRKDDVRAQYGVCKDKFTVLCIGAGWQEGTTKFNDLLSLSRKLPADMQIVLAGKVDEGQHLPNNVIPIGYINGVDELAKVYSMADAYVHVSHEDTFGKVIAEAMACGTPAVVYNSTACPEIVGKGCGYVVDTGDIDGICRALAAIRQNGKESYVSACVAWVTDRFEKEKLLAKTFALYQNLIRGEA